MEAIFTTANLEEYVYEDLVDAFRLRLSLKLILGAVANINRSLT